MFRGEQAYVRGETACVTGETTFVRPFHLEWGHFYWPDSIFLSMGAR